MLTLFISVGIYTIMCIGSSCYSVDHGVLDALCVAGLAEIIYEIKGAVTIYRRKECDDGKDNLTY